MAVLCKHGVDDNIHRCKLCQTALWRAKNREHLKAWRKAYYKRHRARENSQHRVWLQEHREKTREYSRIYASTHKKERAEAARLAYQRSDKHLQAVRKRLWRVRNPEKVAAQKLRHRRKYQAAIKDKMRAWRLANREKLRAQNRLRRRNKRCPICGAAIWQKATICCACHLTLQAATQARGRIRKECIPNFIGQWKTVLMLADMSKQQRKLEQWASCPIRRNNNGKKD